MAKEKSGLVPLVAVEPLRLDGKDVAPGATFEAPPDVAEQLVAAGAAAAEA